MFEVTCTKAKTNLGFLSYWVVVCTCFKNDLMHLRYAPKHYIQCIIKRTEKTASIENTDQLGHRQSQAVCLFVYLICFFTSHQQSFRYIGTGFSGLNQY